MLNQLNSTAPHIEVEKGLDRIRGNKKLYRQMLVLFLDSQEFEVLENSYAAKDWDALGKAVHTIKGMAGNLSLTKLFEFSCQYMEQLRSGQVIEQTYIDYMCLLDETKNSIQQELTAMSE